jgi:hypothetical protein
LYDVQVLYETTTYDFVKVILWMLLGQYITWRDRWFVENTNFVFFALRCLWNELVHVKFLCLFLQTKEVASLRWSSTKTKPWNAQISLKFVEIHSQRVLMNLHRISQLPSLEFLLEWIPNFNLLLCICDTYYPIWWTFY